MFRICLILLFFFTSIFATKIEDITSIVGVRSNQLIGYGLVVGLKGTGDGTAAEFTLQSLSNMLKGVNVKVEPADIKSNNIAAVMVTAELPPFTRQGDKIDVAVSSIGDAESIEGGTLLMTPLKGVDGRIYALAQGQVSTGSQNKANSIAGALIPNGGVVEREIQSDIYQKKRATLSLKEPNFTNAVTVQNTLNSFFGNRVAIAVDAGTVELKKPNNLSMIEFLASVQDLNVRYSRENKIVIDEKSGTVIAGSEVEVEPVVITNGDMTIKVPSIPDVRAVNDIKEGVGVDPANGLLSTTNKPNIASVVRSLSRLGVSSERIIAILEAMKRAGAINVDIEVI